MSRYPKLFFLALLAWPLFVNESVAQRPFERLQRDFQGWRPDGRILREIFGDKDEKEKPARDKEREERPDRRDSRRQGEPTLARTPQPATRPSDKDRAANLTSAAPRKHPVKLEMEVRESKRSAGLIIDRIKKSGAAWAAGLREDDRITKVGGLEVTNAEDIAAIVDVLSNGDQIEFEYVRNGKAATTAVQFGDAPVDSNLEKLAPAIRPRSRDLSLDGNDRNPDPDLMEYNRPREGNFSLQSVLDERLPRQGSTRQGATGAGSETADLSNWQVQPPTSNRSNTPRDTSQRLEVVRIRRQLEKKQQEIKQLQDQLQQATQSSRAPASRDPGSLVEDDR